MDVEDIFNAIRLGFIYTFIITLTIIVQAIANRIMEWTADALDRVDFPQKRAVTMIVLLYIVFVAILIDILIWTAVIMVLGLIDDFLSAFSFATSNFTTNGGNGSFDPPWEFIGPVMSVNGIVIIAFSISRMYDVFYNREKPVETIR